MTINLLAETESVSTDHLPEAARPVLSIVIPAYNVAAFVADAVESALGQTLRDLEVIVVNDGSSDDTLSVVEDLQRTRPDGRLRIISQANAGLSGARNTGIQNANGEFIGFLDADDIWTPDKARMQIAVMRIDPTIGITFSHSAYINEEGEHTGSLLIAKKQEPSLHDMIRRNHIGNGSTPIIRSKCFSIAGLFLPELRSCEDYEMWCRILWRTQYRAALVPLPLTLYRIRLSSLSFDTKAFTNSADQAMSVLGKTMLHLPKRVLRAGHAEHYRIAAWKAALSGRRRAGMSLLAKAVRLRPSLMLYDWRASGTLVALVMPNKMQNSVINRVKAFRSRTRHAGPFSEVYSEGAQSKSCRRGQCPLIP